MEEKTEAEKIHADWSQSSHTPTIAEVKTAALLAWAGYITSLKKMIMKNMDISGIPLDQIEKLTAIVTEKVWIINLTPTSQLGSILACVKCPELWLKNMELS